MALGLPYECNRYCVVITVTAGGALVNVYVPPGGGFLDLASATAWGSANITGLQTSTPMVLQTAI